MSSEKSKINILVNYDYDDPVDVAARQHNGEGNYMVPWLLEKALRKRDDVNVYRRGDVLSKRVNIDFAINSMPVNKIPFMTGDVTAWWDLEECSDPKREYFEHADIIFHPNYNPYRWDLYPPEKSSYLPLANDFDVSRYFPEEPVNFDISFLGREELEIYQLRRDVLDAFQKEWRVLRGSAPRGEPSSRLISQGKLTVQVSGWDNLEERFFQFGAIRPMLADYLEEIDLIAERDKDYISYTSVDEAVEKVRYYLEHQDEAEKIFSNLVEKLKKDHTYDNRAEEVVRIARGGQLDKRGQYLWDKAINLPKKPGYL